MNERIYLHENLYRGGDAIAAMEKTSVTLCGAGAVGSLLADNLARQGIRNMTVIDCDRVEEHNVSTQLYDHADIGAWKAEILRNRLFRACGCEVDSATKKLDKTNVRKLLKTGDVVIDAFDNSESRATVQSFCRSAVKHCMHVGLFEDYCEVIWDEVYRVPSDVDGDVCDYPLARNLVMLAVTIASETLMNFVVNGDKLNRTATLKDFAVREFEAPQP